MHNQTHTQTQLARTLLNWYGVHGRSLPWRGCNDPYRIWVSEIMLQQTRVETVIPYFESWMQTFPTLAGLAQASEQDVLNAWEGLGYYSRARNLLKAAKLVLEELGGKIPRDVRAMRALPGIGRYTAGAIASIAFGMDEPVLDANIKRVYARLFDVSKPANTPAGEELLWQIAREHLPAGKAGAFNQALMDLGALICTPRRPDCSHCPVQPLCRSNQTGIQEERPVLKSKKATPHHFQAAAVVVKDGYVLLAKRPANGLLGGMWEFPNSRVEGDECPGFESAIQREYNLNIRKMAALEAVQHAYTHFKVTVQPFLCELISTDGQKDLLWVELTRLDDYPMGKVDRTIARFLGQARE